MNSSFAAPTDLSLWPDAPAVSEKEMAAWTQAAGYAQPGLDGNNTPLDVLGASLDWGQSGTTFPKPLDNFDFNWAYGGTGAAGMSSHVPLQNATTMRTLAPATMPAFNINTDNTYTGFHLPEAGLAIARTPSLTTDGSFPSPQSDGSMNDFLGFPNTEAGPSSFVQPPGPTFPLDTSGALDPNQLTCAPPSWFTGGSNLAGVEPDFDPDGLLDDIIYPGLWDLIQPTGHLATPTATLTPMVTPEAGPSTSLGKRSRPSDENESGGLKKARPSTVRVPGAAESMKRTRRSPVTRTQQNVNRISKAAGRGAEMLGSTTARGVYDRPLSGLRVPQGSVGSLAQENPSWIVGREVVETRGETGSSAPQQVLPENAEDERLEKIPKRLTQRQKMMLQATQAEKDRGAVSVIRCKLCPEEKFRKWGPFRRHCKSCEKHPLDVDFCSTCGDYFGRRDSRNRHSKYDHEVCVGTSQDDATEKREKVERHIIAYNSRLTDRLKNGQKFKSSFSKVMTQKLKKTSKKVSRMEDTLSDSDDDSWADGL